MRYLISSPSIPSGYKHTHLTLGALIGGHVLCIHYVLGIVLSSLYILTLPTILEVGPIVITLFM